MFRVVSSGIESVCWIEECNKGIINLGEIESNRSRTMSQKLA